MRIDAHAHFEPRLLDVDSLLGKMQAEGIGRTVLVPSLSDPPEPRKPQALMKIQRILFNSVLLRPFAMALTQQMYREAGSWNLAWIRPWKRDARTVRIIERPDNEAVSRLLQLHPGKFWAWAFVNPNQPDAMEELLRFLPNPGIVGIKLHPYWHRYPIAHAAAFFDCARERKLLVNVHLGFGEAGDFHWIEKNYPDTKIIFGHLGVPYYKSIWPVIRDHATYATDTSSLYHVDRSLLKGALKVVGAKKIFFATDAPYSPEDTSECLREWIEKLPISDAEKAGIFYRNFQEFLEKR